MNHRDAYGRGAPLSALESTEKARLDFSYDKYSDTISGGASSSSSSSSSTSTSSSSSSSSSSCSTSGSANMNVRPVHGSSIAVHALGDTAEVSMHVEESIVNPFLQLKSGGWRNKKKT